MRGSAARPRTPAASLPTLARRRRPALCRRRCGAARAEGAEDGAGTTAGAPSPSGGGGDQQAAAAESTEARIDETSAYTDDEFAEEEDGSLITKFTTTVVEPIKESPALRNLVGLVALYFVATFAYSAFKIVRKATSPRAKKRRQVNKNLVVIETLNELGTADPTAVARIGRDTGFDGVLVFRKYLRYLINERKFDAAAVSDVIALKATCGLTDADVRSALCEIARRIFKKYGILMTSATTTAAGLTSDAVMKKATERSIFSKLLYLAELPELVSPSPDNLSESASWQIQEIFGATAEDAAELRITTLSEMDAADLENLVAADDTGAPIEDREDAETAET